MIELKDKLRAMIFCTMCEKKITAQIETLRKQRAQPALPQPAYQSLQSTLPYKTNPHRLKATDSKAIKSVGFFITQYIILAVTALVSLIGACIGIYKIYKHFSAIYVILGFGILTLVLWGFKNWFLYLHIFAQILTVKFSL